MAGMDPGFEDQLDRAGTLSELVPMGYLGNMRTQGSARCVGIAGPGGLRASLKSRHPNPMKFRA